MTGEREGPGLPLLALALIAVLAALALVVRFTFRPKGKGRR